MNPMKTYDAGMAEQFRTALMQHASQLGATLRTDASRAETDTEVLDQKDMAARELETWLADTQAMHVSGELAEIRAALARIDDGTYGRCMDCGESIDLRRLVAMPTAACCASCQGAREGAHRERRA
jgi:DnaK suppressor protein